MLNNLTQAETVETYEHSHELFQRLISLRNNNV